ncbi:LysR family transcriptional regulator [Bradymonas sediminis]|uniref:LysR family transcriptional regulator n=1 Tax=Bradymonas sediminis TaxID=1548548 RepID=UPI001061D3DE|nr:LysR family transcriptional regulator [Bradymonas sediminis]TDP62871.1 DNA-binding transcriptional LysR family regulator [Bradymonas sediminis]
MDISSAMQIFVEVVREEGFTAAARKLKVSKSHVSKQVDRLEEHLGVRLLERTTRQVSVTELGAIYFEHCRRILEEIDEAERAVTSLQASPVGLLRVSAPVSFGMMYLNEVVLDFIEKWPELEIDIHYADTRVDLIGEGFDVAVRIDALDDSGLIARRLAPIKLGLVASPEYLERFGRPGHPRELDGHSCLLYKYQATGTNWRLHGPDGETVVRVEGRVTANNGRALVDAARRGLGIALAPDFIAFDALDSGELEFILKPWSPGNLVLSAVYPHRRYLSQKVRLFIDFLAERYRESPPWACME